MTFRHNAGRRACVGAVAYLLVCASLTPRLAGQEIIDRVLAVVAGDLLTLSDVRAARELGLMDPGRAVDPVREILSRLIDRALVLDEVERYAPPEPTAEAVEGALRTVRRRFDSDQAFAATLARVGITERSLAETLRQDLRIRAYLDQRFPAAQERRDAVIEEWMTGLRRRAEIVDLYGTPPPP